MRITIKAHRKTTVLVKQQTESPRTITAFRMCAALMHQFFEAPVIFFLLSILLFPATSFGDQPSVPQSTGVDIIGIQLRIDEAMYASDEAFELAIDGAIRMAVSDGADRVGRSTLLVFPEYTSVFLALVPYSGHVSNAGSVLDALGRIAQSDSRISSVYSLFAANSSRVEAVMDRVWGGLARKYGVSLVAGTRFVYRDGGLRNALLIYGPGGLREYDQDKVYLTDFELDIVGLSPGTVANARAYRMNGHRIALTVCRDTFFPAWDDAFPGAEYWIDIKANGTEFDAEELARFGRALPVRIARSDATRGMTVCLTGSFLDLFWEGRSFTVHQDSETVTVGQIAHTYTGDATLLDVLDHRTANRDAR